MADKFFGHVAGQYVINPVLECVDVDGVSRRINVDDLVDRLDINRLLDRIDWNKLLHRIDWDRVVLERINVEELVLRTNIGAIVAHSTTGVFTEVLDVLRKQVFVLDVWTRNVAAWLRLRHDLVAYLPPKPGREDTERQGGDSSKNRGDCDRKPPGGGRTRMAIALQGRYTGIVTKGLAFLIDSLCVTFSFALLLIMVELLWMFLMDNNSRTNVDRSNTWVVLVFCTYWFLWFLTSVTLIGKTIGMAIVGIRVVDHKTGRKRISFTQGLIRTTLLPLSSSFVVLDLLALIGFFRQDGRMLHDLAAGTGIVYSWNARMAHLRERMAGNDDDDDGSSEVDDLERPQDPLLDGTARRGQEQSAQSYSAIS